MIVAIASGKGGTGKTTVAVNLAAVIDDQVQLLDCDVEEPNAHLFLRGNLVRQEVSTIPVPEIDESLCDGCGACSRFCRFHALVSFGKAPMVFPEMCHGCGGCAAVCPQHAIHEVDRPIGVVETIEAARITLIRGVLDVGVVTVPALIRDVRGRMRGDISAIIDAPPGTTCPAMTAVRQTDFSVLVTEPTAFGLHDLTIAVDMVKALEVPFGVVVNRAGSGDDRVHSFCADHGIQILAEIPDDRRVAEAYSRGEIVVDVLPEYRKLYRRLLAEIGRQVAASTNRDTSDLRLAAEAAGRISGA